MLFGLRGESSSERGVSFRNHHLTIDGREGRGAEGREKEDYSTFHGCVRERQGSRDLTHSRMDARITNAVRNAQMSVDWV